MAYFIVELSLILTLLFLTQLLSVTLYATGIPLGKADEIDSKIDYLTK